MSSAFAIVAAAAVSVAAQAAEPSKAALATTAASTATATPAPAPAERRIIEDDNTRIEETRVRGQLSRVTVQSKLGAGRQRYEIIVGPGGRDPSQKNAQGASGQRAWSVLSF